MKKNMKHSSLRKITLSRETLRQLSPDLLGHIAGGGTTIPTSNGGNCTSLLPCGGGGGGGHTTV